MTPTDPKDVPPPPVPKEDTFEKYIEWTVEEEEAFLKILSDSENKKASSETYSIGKKELEK